MALDTLTSMTVFRQAAERGSLVAAARTLGMSPEMAGHHLRMLESRLGARLLNRTTRRLSLTEAGHAYHARCVAILDEVTLAEAEAGQSQSSPRGHVRVAAPLAFGTALLAPPVSAFLDRHPEVSVDVDLSERPVSLVNEGYDLALRLGDLPDSSLVARRLAGFRLLLVAAPDYVARRGRPVRLDELREHEALIYTQTTRPGSWRFLDDRGQASEIAVGGRIRSSDVGFLLELAIAGRGLLLAPSFLLRPFLSDGRLTQLLPEWRARDLPLHALLPHRSLAPASVRAFVSFLSGWFASSADAGAEVDAR